MSFEKSIEITREIDGTIRYRDEAQNTMYLYDPRNNAIIITSLSDKFAAKRDIPLPESPMEAIERLMETLRQNGEVELSVEQSKMNGQAVEIIHARSKTPDKSPISQNMTIIINSESKLPIHLETAVTQESGEHLGSARVDFDYPDKGPKDIYEVGAPKDAVMVDRRPRPDGKLDININYRFIASPENSQQKMLILYGGINVDLVRIPEGEFLMGSPDSEVGYPGELGRRIKEQFGRLRPDTESPQHLVKIVRGFYMSKYEITCEQFRHFRPEFRKYKYENRDMDLDGQPACVSLNDALEFCAWLSEKTGLAVRLPSEAEWEYACRAGTQSRFYWGDSEEEAGKYANIADKAYSEVWPDRARNLNTDDGNAFLASVGKYLPNAFGLYDMIGNAPEWSQSVYSKNAYSIDPENKSFTENKERYVRGGSWASDIINCRCASRWWVNPPDVPSVTTPDSHIGFRIIIDEE